MYCKALHSIIHTFCEPTTTEIGLSQLEHQVQKVGTIPLPHRPFCLDDPFFPLSPPPDFPTTVTPFPFFTILSSAFSFSLFTPPIPFTFFVVVPFSARASLALSTASRIFFFCLRSFVRATFFSWGVSSDLERREDGEGAKISSGASMVAMDWVVGMADSREAVATLEMDAMVVFGWIEDFVSTVFGDSIEQNECRTNLLRRIMRITERIQLRTNPVPHPLQLRMLLRQLPVPIIHARRTALRSHKLILVALPQPLLIPRILQLNKSTREERLFFHHPPPHHVVKVLRENPRLDALFEVVHDFFGDDGRGLERAVEVEVGFEGGIFGPGAGGGFAAEDPVFGGDVFGFEGDDLGFEGGLAFFVLGEFWWGGEG